MGYNTLTSSTPIINAKLTALGKQLMFNGSGTTITSFSLGDSDANYLTNFLLQIGEIPGNSGDLGPNSTRNNSVPNNVRLRNRIVVNSSGSLTKPIESIKHTINNNFSGYQTLTGISSNIISINRNDFNSTNTPNYFKSFGLPITNNDLTQYTATTFSNGGFSNTALSGLSNENVLIVNIDNSTYGQQIDGKSVYMYLETSGNSYNIYGTYQNKGISLTSEDNNVIETSVSTQNIGDNIVILFSDEIKRPNDSLTLSWATGHNTNKPFSNNSKQLFNLVTNNNLGRTADTAVGVAYLDKGFIVITDPLMNSEYDFFYSGSSATTVSFNNFTTEITKNITCIVDRGEFTTSTNPTFSIGDTVRISEVGLYDNFGNLIAYGKTDRHISKNVNEFLALSVNIVI